MPKVKGHCDRDNSPLQRRSDDEESVVLNRLEVYHRQTKPLEQFYRQASLLTEVRGDQSPEEVFAALVKITDSVGAL